MIKKNYRLPASFFRERRKPLLRLVTPLAVVKIFFSSFKYPRYAAVAPAKEFPKAVLRNQARRILYKEIRRGEYEKKMHGDFIFLLSRRILEASPGDIKKLLDAVFKETPTLS